MDYKEKSKEIAAKDSKYVHTYGGRDSREFVTLDLPLGKPSGNPVSTEMILQQVYSRMVHPQFKVSTSSAERATIACDVRPNTEFKTLWKEYKRLVSKQKALYKASLKAWYAAQRAARQKAIDKLRKVPVFRTESVFQLRFRADANTEVAGQRETQRNWTFIGSVYELVNAVWSGPFKSSKTIRGRLINFLKSSTGKSSRIQMRQTFWSYLHSGVADCYAYAKESKIVRRVKQRKTTLRRGKIRYAKSALLSEMALWYESHPKPARPVATPEMLRLKKQMTEATMFHHMSRTRVGCFSIPTSERLAVDLSGINLPETVPLGTAISGCHKLVFNYYDGTTFHREEEGVDYDDINVDLSGDFTKPKFMPMKPYLRDSTFVTSDGSVSPDNFRLLPSGDFIASRLAALSGQELDLASFELSNDNFNVFRSTMELKDMPGVFKVLGDLGMADLTLSDRPVPGLYDAKAMRRVTGGKLKALTGLRLVIACHLSYIFGVEPTMNDVQHVLDEGLDWAISMKRAVRQLLAGMRDFASSLTLGKRLRVTDVSGKLVSKADLPRRRLTWPSAIGASRYKTLLSCVQRGSGSGATWEMPDMEDPANWPLHLLYGDQDRGLRGFDEWLHGFNESDFLTDSLFTHVIAVDGSSRFFMRPKMERVLDALGYDQWSSWLQDLEPLTVSWELTGLSFIVDWFTNSGRIVRNLTRKLQILSDRYELGDQGMWYTLQVEHGLVDHRGMLRKYSGYPLRLKPELIWNRFWHWYSWGPYEPAPAGVPVYGDNGTCLALCGDVTVKATPVVSPDVSLDGHEGEGLPIIPIGRSTIRTSCELPGIWESIAPAFQLKIDFGKIRTLAELITSSFR